MVKEKQSKKTGMRKSFIVLVVLVFFIMTAVVFFVSRRVTTEMSESAIGNLTESLTLIQNTIETFLSIEADFQKEVARQLGLSEALEADLQSYSSNETMVKLSLVFEGETEGISNTGERFVPEELDFSTGKIVNGLPISAAYLNSMGTWAYTMSCPVLTDGRKTATLYVEYLYDFLDEMLPDSFYDGKATIYLMDTVSERLVLIPKGMGGRDAGHLNLDDFCRANDIGEKSILGMISENLSAGKNVMFYHDVQSTESLIYMWSVENNVIYLIGYVPISAIQREGAAVNQNIYIVVASMLMAFLACFSLFFFTERQKSRFWKEREEERKVHNAQLAEALQAAQVASHSKTTFLANMSHDIRTPMNAILGFTALLEKNAGDPARVLDYTKKITDSGKHLLGLINDVLDVSKIESGKVVLTVEEFPLNHVVNSVDSIIRPLAKAKGQELSVSVAGVRHEVFLGDETRLNQILLNLLSNAVKYTGKGGKIWLRIIGLEPRSPQYEHIRIEVEDNGYGMTPEYLEVIFDAFTRAENSTTNKVQGTGLGMAITKNIVELMGGSIKVSSEVDKGSLFTVELELRIPDKKTKDSSGDHPDVGHENLEGFHFLVAEDNEINAEIMQEFLDMDGATCELVENGKFALERFRDTKPGHFDAILMDIQMPVMNGYDATRAIRLLDREDAKTIPIIAMTANAFSEDVREALEAGINAHVAKPIDMKLLRIAVNQYSKKGNRL